ncbi:MAG: pyridoxal-phosphate-dependent aminotransferase family protein [Candidatus Dormibacteraceae bacterium]
MIFQPQLRIPGPTPIPDRIVRAAARPMVDHRGPEFKAVVEEVVRGVKRVFATENDLLIFTASGSGGLESAVANLVSPGDQVIAAVSGNFGERFAAIADAYGCDVVRLFSEWGEPITPEDLGATLEANPGTKLVLLTHNETSTGLTNPLADLARVVHRAGALLAVDGVSSVGSMPVDVDANGIDVAVTGSQKGFMSPPGIAFLTVGERAWAANRTAKAPRSYFDWAPTAKAVKEGATPYTPAIAVLYAVQEGLRVMFEEGLPQVYRRHRVLADGTAAGLQAMGFRLFAAEGYRSAVVTAAIPPEGVAPDSYRKLLRERYGVVIGGGQGKMAGKMVRVGHLAAVAEGDMVQVLWALEQALEDLDIAPNEGRGLGGFSTSLRDQPASTPAPI